MVRILYEAVHNGKKKYNMIGGEADWIVFGSDMFCREKNGSQELCLLFSIVLYDSEDKIRFDSF